MNNATGSRDHRLVVTSRDQYGGEYSREAAQSLSLEQAAAAYDMIRTWPGYAATPEVEFPALANRFGLRSLRVKNEGRRFEIGSFKALGPPYALANILIAEIQRRTATSEVSSADLFTGSFRDITSSIVVTAPTSGNHGRALAWAARQFGCRAVIYMPEATSPGREAAIAAYGAETIRVPADFDGTAEHTEHEAVRHGYLMIGDTSPAEHPDSTRQIIHGYSVLAQEIIDKMATDGKPTHVFVSAGIGNMAAALTGRLWMEYGDERPRMVVVEPHSADAFYQSALRNSRTAASGDLVTVMDGLSVGVVSPLAWNILRAGAFAGLTIDDSAALEALRLLARPPAPDVPLGVGETGIAAFAGFLEAARDPQIRDQLGLTESSCVLAIGCEGVTDPEVYARLLDDDPRMS